MKSTLVAFVVAIFAMTAFAAEGQVTSTAPVNTVQADTVVVKKAKKGKKGKKKKSKKAKRSKKKAAAAQAAPAAEEAPAMPAAGQ